MRLDTNGQKQTKRTESDKTDRNGQKMTKTNSNGQKQTSTDKNGLNGPRLMEWTKMDRNRQQQRKMDRSIQKWTKTEEKNRQNWTKQNRIQNIIRPLDIFAFDGTTHNT